MTAASRSVMRGVSLQDVQGVLGHLIVTLTLKCSHPVQKHKKSRNLQTGKRLNVPNTWIQKKWPVSQ
jgi:hypothetical protein